MQCLVPTSRRIVLLFRSTVPGTERAVLPACEDRSRGQRPLQPSRVRVMPGTDIANVDLPTSLRACDAISGTDMAHGAVWYLATRATSDAWYWRSERCAKLGTDLRAVLPGVCVGGVWRPNQHERRDRELGQCAIADPTHDRYSVSEGPNPTQKDASVQGNLHQTCDV
eukprot:2440258-Rhodomonas_salina.11